MKSCSFLRGAAFYSGKSKNLLWEPQELFTKETSEDSQHHLIEGSFS